MGPARQERFDSRQKTSIFNIEVMLILLAHYFGKLFQLIVSANFDFIQHGK